MNENEFVQILESFYKSKKSGEQVFRLGTISSSYTTGLPKVLLDGDDGVGDVTYPHLFSYAPSANDRVLLVRFGTSYLILGKINNTGSLSGGVVSGTIDWGNITGKPSTFLPSSHTHAWSDITGKPTTFTPSTHTHDWVDITGKPSTFTPSAHNHAIGDVTGLQTALDGKSSTTHSHNWSDIVGKPTTFPPDLHSHSWTDITGKPSTFAPSAHAHLISEITNLQTTLDGKSSTSHTHNDATTSVSGFMSATDKAKLDSVATNANNYSHPTGDGNLHVPATSTTNNLKVLKAGSTAGSIAWGSVDWVEIVNKPTTFTPSTHTHSDATTTVSGFMSGADKNKLNGIATNANNYVHPTTDGNKHVPANGTTNNGKVLKATSTAGTYSWGNVDWAEITGVPSTFTPSAHTHTTANITDIPSKPVGLNTVLSSNGTSLSWLGVDLNPQLTWQSIMSAPSGLNISSDSSKQTLPLNAGIVAVSGSVPSYVKTGLTVVLNGGINSAIGLVGTLPVGARPSSTCFFTATLDTATQPTTPTTFKIETSGAITIITRGNTTSNIHLCCSFII